MRSQAYDLVLNGWELGSGIGPDPPLRRAVARSSGCSASARRRRRPSSGSCSTPSATARRPHAGFAFGIDRLVALLVGEENIREVIAFPKTQSGADPLTNAPTEIEPRYLDELGLRVLPRKA